MSESIFSETHSVFTATGTFTSTSTIPGLGSLSGKAIKRVGTAVVNGVDAIIIRRRLAQLEAMLGQKVTTADSRDVKSLYSDLLELSRPVYSLSIRTRALRVIMGRVGAMDSQDLAVAVANWPISESYDLLKAMVLCFRGSSTSGSLSNGKDGDNRAKLNLYYDAGLEAYNANLPYEASLPEALMLKSNLCLAAFLIYLGLIISASKSPAFSRLLIELDIPLFITETYPSILESKHRWSLHLLPARLVLCALIENLDPAKDALSISHVLGLLKEVKPSIAISPFRKEAHSKIDQLQRFFLGKEDWPMPNILLLGSGESGKTTVMKQILKAFAYGHTNTDYIEPIMDNVFDALDRLASAAIEAGWSQEYYENILATSRATSRFGLMSIQEECQYLLDNRYQILRKSEYFLDALPRILAENYLPSDADITRCYIRTTGIHATSFSMKGSESFTLLDFGGQRSERKKWINCFKDAGIVIFVASLDEYDEGLFEDPTINRMQEALALFDSIVNSRWFIETPMVLFLNKIDLFSEKISYSPLPREHFPDYRGGNDYDAALDFIINQYLLLNRTGRPIRIFVTSAVDEMQIKNVMEDVYDEYIEPLITYLNLGSPDVVIDTILGARPGLHRTVKKRYLKYANAESSQYLVEWPQYRRRWDRIIM